MLSRQQSAVQRTACDRCRQQRLKCMRDETHDSCHRCTRLAKLCVMGQAKRPGRPKKTRPSDIDTNAYGTPPSSTGQSPQSADNVTAGNTAEPYPALDEVGIAQPGRGVNIGSPATGGIGISDGDGALSLINAGGFSDQSFFDMPWITVDPPIASLPEPTKTVPKLDFHQCLKELSELNVELHGQWSFIKTKGDGATLHTYICSVYANATGFVIGEASLVASQRLGSILANVEWLLRQSSQTNMSSSDYSPFDANLGLFSTPPLDRDSDAEFDAFRTLHDPIPSPLPTPLALTMISCYVQLVNLFSDMFRHILRYLAKLKNEPIPTVDNVKFIRMGNFCAMDGRLQGLLFCSMVTHSLDRIERTLGVLQDSRHQSVPLKQPLLNRPHLRNLLEKELEREGIAGSNSSKRLRETVETLRRDLTADPSW
jgi:hypothetical protein